MSIENELEELKRASTALENELKFVNDTLYKGSVSGDILPLHTLTNILREIKVATDKHTDLIGKMDREGIRARNQMVYMFLTLLGTLLGKLVLQYFTGN